LLEEKELEGILFFSPENLRYLSGFTGGEGVLLALKGKRVLLVDFRYLEQAQEEVSGSEVQRLEGGMKGVAQALRRFDLRRVGLEAQGLSLAGYGRLAEEAQGVEFVPLDRDLEALRRRKGPEEVERIRRAVEMAEGALKEVLEMIRPGVKESEVALELEFRMRRLGSEGVAFDPIVASGPRSALPHAKPSLREIREGDVVIVDFGARFDGYCSDETRTFFVGRPEEELRKVYRVVKEAHDRALEAIKPGVPLKEIDRRARDHIKEAGYGDYFGHGTGHGVGLVVHEPPTVNEEAQGEAEVGMVFTVEPGIYLPDRGGVRIEDLVLVTEGGCQVLTGADEGPEIL